MKPSGGAGNAQCRALERLVNIRFDSYCLYRMGRARGITVGERKGWHASLYIYVLYIDLQVQSPALVRGSLEKFEFLLLSYRFEFICITRAGLNKRYCLRLFLDAR